MRKPNTAHMIEKSDPSGYLNGLREPWGGIQAKSDANVSLVGLACNRRCSCRHGASRKCDTVERNVWPNFARMEAARSATTSRVTHNFAHLVNGRGVAGVYRMRARLRNPLMTKSKDAHPIDRIKFWNIVPGDKVRLIRGPKRDPERVVEVLSVNKLRNLILLKDLTVGSYLARGATRKVLFPTT